MATFTQTRTLTAAITGFRYDTNGDVHVDFQMLDESGVVQQTRSLTVKADGTGVYDSRDGSQIVPTSPAAFITGAANIKTQVENMLTAAATAGKLVA